MALLLVVATQSAQAQTYTVLHRFHGKDGGELEAGLVRDSAGNLYGATTLGGNGYGVVFKVDKTGHQTVLYAFTGEADGGTPEDRLIRDAEGNFYGTAQSGGNYGYGVVFELDMTGKETVLYSFTGGAEGENPKPV